MVKVNQIISEKHYTGPLYHATTIQAAKHILKTKTFKLSDATGREEYKIQKHFKRDKFKYYFSVSRSLGNSYRAWHNVTFVINPGYFTNSNMYYMEPVDWPHHHGYIDTEIKARSESEERIWSVNRNIPVIDSTIEIHVNYPGHWRPTSMKGSNSYDIVNVLAHEYNIPIYFYNTDKNAYILHNKNKAITNLDKLEIKEKRPLE